MTVPIVRYKINSRCTSVMA